MKKFFPLRSPLFHLINKKTYKGNKKSKNFRINLKWKLYFRKYTQFGNIGDKVTVKTVMEETIFLKKEKL